MSFLIVNLISAIRLLVSMSALIAVILSKGDGKEIFRKVILIGIVTDLTDGNLARALNANSKLGHKLDLVADGVCFGLIPTFHLFYILPTAKASFLQLLVVIYSIIRIRTSDWVCTGVPLPIVGVTLMLIIEGRKLNGNIFRNALMLVISSYISLLYFYVTRSHRTKPCS